MSRRQQFRVMAARSRRAEALKVEREKAERAERLFLEFRSDTNALVAPVLAQALIVALYPRPHTPKS